MQHAEEKDALMLEQPLASYCPCKVDQQKGGEQVGADLGRKAGASVHDEGPELVAAGNRGDVQAIIVALLHMLVHARIGHIVMVALLHRPVCIVDRNPLRRRQPQPDLFLGSLSMHITPD